MEEYIIGTDGRKRVAVHNKCKYCGKDFLVRKGWANKQFYCSRECSSLAHQKRITVNCTYCNKPFEKVQSKLNNSRSGLYFCCREHKDLAQRLDFGCKEIMPDHYGTITGISSYRKLAFYAQDHKCAVCGWCEDERVLEVHHIDEDRSNNDINNLIILCPICHRYLTLHLYTLEELRTKL